MESNDFMILTRKLLAEELLTTFTVKKVHCEPHAESEWTLQFEDYPPIIYFDKCFGTREEDVELVGKKIRAQIDLEADYDEISLITDPIAQKKTVYYDKASGHLIAVGIYFDDAKEAESKYENNNLDACIDSIFRLRVFEDLGANKFNFKKGDWVKIETTERCVLLSRSHMPLEK